MLKLFAAHATLVQTTPAAPVLPVAIRLTQDQPEALASTAMVTGESRIGWILTRQMVVVTAIQAGNNIIPADGLVR